LQASQMTARGASTNPTERQEWHESFMSTSRRLEAIENQLVESRGNLKVLNTRKNELGRRHREEHPAKRLHVAFSSMTEGKVRQILKLHDTVLTRWQGDIKAEAFNNYLTVPRAVSKFDWKERESEAIQTPEAIGHLDKILRPCGLPVDLCLLNVTGNRHLFDQPESEDTEYTLTGTSDAIIVANDQKDEPPMSLHTSTFLVIEFKKKVIPDDYRQAQSILIAVDGLQGASRFPVVVLTDLGDNFVFFWFGMHRSQKKLLYYKAPSFRIASLLMCTLAIEEARKEGYVESHRALSDVARSYPWFAPRFKFNANPPPVQMGGDSKQEAGDVLMGHSDPDDTTVLPTGSTSSQSVGPTRKKLRRRDDEDDIYYKYRETYLAAMQYFGTWKSDVQRPMSPAAVNMYV